MGIDKIQREPAFWNQKPLIKQNAKKNSLLYHALSDWLGQAGDWSHLSHLTTCIWLVIAVIHTGSVNLTKWVTHVPCRGVFAQSVQRRIQRWLYNPRINIHRLYKRMALKKCVGKGQKA